MAFNMEAYNGTIDEEFTIDFYNETTDDLWSFVRCVLSDIGLWRDDDYTMTDFIRLNDSITFEILVEREHALAVLNALTNDTTLSCSESGANLTSILTLVSAVGSDEAPCFGGDERVRMADGSTKAFRELATGKSQGMFSRAL